MPKIKNPLETATQKVFDLYEDLSKGMNFTDVTAINTDIQEIKTKLFTCEEFELLACLNKVQGGMTALLSNKDRSVVAVWDDVKGESGAVLTVTANSLGDLTMAFVLTGDCEAANINDMFNHEEF
jgi:hypothetical protein